MALTSVHFLYNIDVTNQKPRNLLHRQGTHTRTHAYGLYSEVALAKNGLLPATWTISIKERPDASKNILNANKSVFENIKPGIK